MPPLIRDEEARDRDSIRRITQDAFRNHPFSEQTEHLIVDALREQGALTLSLVASEDGHIIGHIAFSPVRINDNFDGWYGLGPVSVSPNVQNRGTGSALVREGMRRMKEEKKAQGIVLLGDPGYYSRFGFEARPSLVFPGVPADHFLMKNFAGEIPSGTVSYHEAFYIKP